MSRPAASVRSSLEKLSVRGRQEYVEQLILAEFKHALMLDEADMIDPRASFFDLGLTSLKLEELKQRFETLFEVSIDASELFKHHSIEQFCALMWRELGGRPMESSAEPSVAHQQNRVLVDSLLSELCTPSQGNK